MIHLAFSVSWHPKTFACWFCNRVRLSVERQVIIVVSSEFAPKLDELALSSPVWAVQTAATEEVARRIWEEHPSQGTDQLTSGLTLFQGEGDPEDDLLSILDEGRAPSRNGWWTHPANDRCQGVRHWADGCHP